MGPSLLRRAALPPRAEVEATDAEVRMRAHGRMAMIAVVLAFDVALLLLLRSSPTIRPGALRAFAAINLPLLLLDLVCIPLLLRKRGPWFGSGQILCGTLEIVTTLTWIQLTGIVSSYFLIAGPLLIVAYRVFSGYWAAMWGTALLTTGHIALFLAEELHVLPPASLFVDAGQVYSSPVFRWGALASITGIYSSVLWAANFTATAFREKDVALSAARKDVARAIEDGQLGRLVGETIGGYALREVLGRGGMGEVYRAERLADGREAAVKVLQRNLGWQTDVVARFRREVDLVRRMKSRGVAEILDAGETGDGLHYLAMELLRGEDMAALLRRRERLSLGELLAIVDPLAETLDDAHAHGIVHRDVKPQNIFLARAAGETGMVVKLLDFGVARLLETSGEEKLTQTFAVVGTPGYLAPEQISPSFGAVGAETDIFALGAVAYRALTGRPAFEATHLAEVLQAALHGQPPAPSALVVELTPAVDAVIALAIAKRPRHRYPSARAFAADLRAAQEGRLAEEVRARARELAAFSSEAISETIRAAAG